MFKFSGIVLSYVLFINSAYANCEAGAFFIHTTAVYHQNPKIQFLAGGSTSKLIYPNNNSPSVKSEKYTLMNPIGKCQTVNIKMKEPEHDLDVLTYFITGCSEITKESNYFYYIDAEKKTIVIGKPLKFTKDKITNTTIEKNITSLVEKNYIRTGPVAKNATDYKFEKKDFPNSNYLTFEHTFIGTNFIVSVALIEISNISKYFGFYGNNPYDNDTAKKNELLEIFNKKNLSFPVIYFTQKEKTQFVGDGSWCSDYAINELLEQYKYSKSKSTTLGPVYKFDVTAAYDTNDDGIPNVITINDSFSYWINNDGTPLVIGIQLGC